MLMTQPTAPAARSATAHRDGSARWADCCSLQFAAQPAAGPAARSHLACLLGEWGLCDLADTAQLLASELLANAVTAAQDAGGPQLIQFCVGRGAASLIIEVGDPSPEPPAARRAESMDEGGRGLHLVEVLSTAWGFYRLPSGGKVVWCQIALND